MFAPRHRVYLNTIFSVFNSQSCCTDNKSSCNDAMMNKMMERLQSGSSKEHTTRRSPDYYQENHGVVEGFYDDYNYYGDSDTYPDIPPPPRRPQNNDYSEGVFQVQEIKQQWTAKKHGSDYIEEAFQERTTSKYN